MWTGTGYRSSEYIGSDSCTGKVSTNRTVAERSEIQWWCTDTHIKFVRTNQSWKIIDCDCKRTRVGAKGNRVGIGIRDQLGTWAGGCGIKIISCHTRSCEATSCGTVGKCGEIK